MSSNPATNESFAVPAAGVPVLVPRAPSKDCAEATRGETRRVLHLINGEHYAGAERVQDLLAMRLPELGFEVAFGCVKPKLFPDRRQAQATTLYDLGMRGRFDLRPARRVAELVRREGFALLHAHTPRTALIGRIAAAWSGVPLVYHVHSPTSRDTTHRLRNWVNASVERWAMARAVKLIAVSASLGRHLRECGVPEGRVAVVPNGVPCVDRVPERQPPLGSWTLGAVALFRPRKGTEVLLEALALLRARNHDVRLRAVGPFESADYEHKLKTLAAERRLEDRIAWTGFCSDVSAELAQMDLFILPSLFGEGLPMVVLEAMAAGVPVVATQVEGVPEAVRDGVDGVLAEPREPAALAAAIERVIGGELDWTSLRSRALARQRERFSDVSMAAGVAGVYREVLSRVARQG